MEARLRYQSLIQTRVGLAVLVLVAVLPALSLLVYSDVSQRSDAADEVRTEAQGYARTASTALEISVEGIRNILRVVSLYPHVRAGQWATAEPFLQEIAASYREFATLGIATSDGEVVYCTVPPGRTTVAERSWFERVIKTGKFAMSDYQVGLISHRDVVAFGLPIPSDGEPTGSVVFLSVQLEYFDGLLKTDRLPSAAVLVMVDDDGRLLAQSIAHDQLGEGRRHRGESMTDLLPELAGPSDPGTTEKLWPDGLTRLSASSSIPAEGGGRMRVYVGVESSAAFAKVRRNSAIHLLAGIRQSAGPTASLEGGHQFADRTRMSLAWRAAVCHVAAKHSERRVQEDTRREACRFDEVTYAQGRLHYGGVERDWV